MGKGDKKTKRGKIVIGSCGVRRARKKRKNVGIAKIILEPKPPKPVVEKKVFIEDRTAEVVVQTEVAEEMFETKKTVKKPAAKKTTEKAENDPDKPKTPKTRKKTTELPDTKEEPSKS